MSAGEDERDKFKAIRRGRDAELMWRAASFAIIHIISLESHSPLPMLCLLLFCICCQVRVCDIWWSPLLVWHTMTKSFTKDIKACHSELNFLIYTVIQKTIVRKKKSKYRAWVTEQEIWKQLCSAHKHMLAFHGQDKWEMFYIIYVPVSFIIALTAWQDQATKVSHCVTVREILVWHLC